MQNQTLSIDIYFKDTLKDAIVDMLLEEYGLFRMFIDEQKAQFIINKLLQAFGKEDMRIYTHCTTQI